MHGMQIWPLTLVSFSKVIVLLHRVGMESEVKRLSQNQDIVWCCSASTSQLWDPPKTCWWVASPKKQSNGDGSSEVKHQKHPPPWMSICPWRVAGRLKSLLNRQPHRQLKHPRLIGHLELDVLSIFNHVLCPVVLCGRKTRSAGNGVETISNSKSKYSLNSTRYNCTTDLQFPSWSNLQSLSLFPFCFGP